MANNVDLNIRTNADKAAASMTKLNSSIVDQVKKVQQLEKGYKVLDDAFNKGLISAQKYAKGTQQVDKAIKQTIASQNKLASSTQQVSKKLNQKSMILQQTGLQVGDLAVQVQSGTGFLLAFGQQATQLIGTFSLLAKSTKMIALFSGLGVLVPIATAIAGSFLRVGDSAEKAEDKVSGLKKSLSALKDIQSTLVSGPEALFGRFGANAEKAKALLDLRLKVVRAETQAQVRKSGGFLSGEGGFGNLTALFQKREQALKTVQDRMKSGGFSAGDFAGAGAEAIIGGGEGQALEQLGAELTELERKFSVSRAGAISLFNALASVGGSKTIEDQVSAGQKLAETLEQTGASFEELSAEEREAFARFTEGSITLIELQKALKDAEENTFESKQKTLRAQRAAIALAQQEVQIATQAEAVKEAFKSEETALARKKELLQLEIKFGKESTQVREKIQEFERLEYAASLRKQGLYEGFVRSLVAQREETQGLANESEKVADAAERTEKALSSLRGFGESVSVQLAQAKATLEALRTGGDAAAAGRIAGLNARLAAAAQQARNAGLGGLEGLVPGEVENLDKVRELLIALAEIAKTKEEIRKQEEAERRSRREARKLGPAGPKLMEDSVKEFFKIGDFEKQIELERELLFVTEDRARVLKQFGLDFAERNPEIIQGLEEQIRATREIAQVGSVVQKSFEDGFLAIIEGSKSVVGAFKDMARLIIKELFKILVVQRIVGFISAGIEGFVGGLGSAAPSQSPLPTPRPKRAASGGTLVANKPFLVGERGPELVMPNRQGSIYNADLTSKAMNGSGKITQVFNFNLSANGDESVKKIVAQAAPQIADMAQKGVIAARRRGGTMRSTFG
tara:strand:- start:793 stop:3366 length:2574 start_codon:yes stop_codon:yes gene_type:complete